MYKVVQLLSVVFLPKEFSPRTSRDFNLGGRKEGEASEKSHKMDLRAGQKALV